MNRLSWYYNRLTKMPPAEILHRLHHKTRQWRDKRFAASSVPSPPMDLKVDLELAAKLSEHVTQADLDLWQASLSVSVVAMADQALERSFDVFGIRSSHPNGVNWHLDAVTGNQWPLEFWSSIDIRDGTTVGGVKFTWEHNRLYCLPILGMAYKLTGEKRYADHVFYLLESWLAGNPYPLGVNWSSGIELGVRLANLVWALSFLEGYEIGKGDSRSVNRFIQLHGYHLYRYPSKYSSNNNHALAEALGLFLAAVFFPSLKGAEKWLIFGKGVLEREVTRQILPDGGSYEYSTTYLSFTADFFLLYRMVCFRLGLEYDPSIDERLERSGEYIHHLMDCKGNVPNIGDQDSAILVNFGLSNQENYVSLLNTVGLLFSRPDLLRGDLDYKTCVLLGEVKKQASSGEERSTRSGHKQLQESGLSIIRGQGAGRELVLVANATPMGMPPLYAHGHLDALSFTLSIDGQEVLVDPGTYLYHSGGKWRQYFRSVAAHNTIRVNSTDLTLQPGPFMFGVPYQITGHRLYETDEGITWEASHNAYLKFKEPVYLSRRIGYDHSSGTVLIEDCLESDGSYSVEQFFHLHPHCRVVMKNREAKISPGTVDVRMLFDRQLEVKALQGQNEPLAGWFSEAFNHLQESVTIITTGILSGRNVLRTEIVITERDVTAI